MGSLLGSSEAWRPPRERGDPGDLGPRRDLDLAACAADHDLAPGPNLDTARFVRRHNFPARPLRHSMGLVRRVSKFGLGLVFVGSVVR
jgi:hypothetical protein